MRLTYLLALLSSLVLLGSANAYYNVTFINTTLILNGNSSAHVVETFNIYVSNSSMQQYTQNRNAVGISLSDWQNIIYTTQLTQHIINAHHSTYGFTFLPGPLITEVNGGDTIFTMSYYVNNVTSIKNVAPRQFEYTFNDTLFNFENTANGQVLPADVRLNIIIPTGSEALLLYPLPDLPAPAVINDYKNNTAFSWFSGEPLSQFSFSFIATQSLQTEVLSYFSDIYGNYKVAIYLVVIVAIALAIVYVYLKSGREASEDKHKAH
jgi:uncharacterized protein YpmB